LNKYSTVQYLELYQRYNTILYCTVAGQHVQHNKYRTLFVLYCTSTVIWSGFLLLCTIQYFSTIPGHV
jgi:hypothetical protein